MSDTYDFTFSADNERVAYDHKGDVAYRARIILDTDPQPPEFDYGCPVFELRYDNYGCWRLDPTSSGGESADNDGLPLVLNDAFSLVHDRRGKNDALAILDRWLRMFHGGSLNVQDVGYGRGTTLISYDTRAMREHWGQTGKLLETSAPDAGEWPAYIEGEVYGYVIERALADDDLDEDELDWEELDSCWGFYGEEYVKEQAVSELTAYATTLPNEAIETTVVIPEHTVTTRTLPPIS